MHTRLLVVTLCMTACGPTARPDVDPAPVAPTVAVASAESAAVLAVAQHLFDAMAAHDSAALRQILLPAGSFVVVAGEGDSVRVGVTPLEEFIARIGRSGPALHERMWRPRVLIDGPLAVVWTSYDFHIDGEFSHCGIDAFTLARTASGWLITGGSYTVQRTGCPDAPAPDL